MVVVVVGGIVVVVVGGKVVVVAAGAASELHAATTRVSAMVRNRALARRPYGSAAIAFRVFTVLIGRIYPFTAPPVNPEMMCLWRNRKREQKKVST